MITQCNNEDCKEFYPHYGLAPHNHYMMEDSPEFIGTTKFLAKKDWPKNFIEDKDEPGMGIWYCPNCMNALAELEQGE